MGTYRVQGVGFLADRAISGLDGNICAGVETTVILNQ